MKNILTLTVEQLTSYYSETMLEQLNAYREDLSPVEFADDLISFASILKNMCSSNNTLAIGVIRQELKAGCTSMMIPCKEFAQIEKWSENNEDFQLVLYREDGSAVGVIESKYFSW